MSNSTESLHQAITELFPEDTWQKILDEQPNKRVDAQAEYFVLRAIPHPAYHMEGHQLLKALQERYIPYHCEVGFPIEIEFTPLKLKFNTRNIDSLKVFTTGYKKNYGVICYDGIPLPVIVKYAERHSIL